MASPDFHKYADLRRRIDLHAGLVPYTNIDDGSPERIEQVAGGLDAVSLERYTHAWWRSLVSSVSPADIAHEWMMGGIFTPSLAPRLREAGLFPGQVQYEMADGRMLGELIESGEMSVADAAEYVRAERITVGSRRRAARRRR